MNEPINCFILSAGFGERLKPITDNIPKPLMPILGKPALQYVIERVSAIPPKKIGINLHYKKEIIADWLSSANILDSHKITLFYEEKLLGTGGALKNAENLLKDNHFLVYNSDIFSDIDLQKLIKYHLSGDNIATLAVHDCPEFNSLEIDEKGFLIGISKKKSPPLSKLYAFIGIAIYSPDFLNFLPEGFSSAVLGWINAISSGAKIACLVLDGYIWSDIGTPSAYAAAVIRGLKSEGEIVYIHPSIKYINNIEFDGHLVVEKNSIIEKGAYLKNCILLPDSYTVGTKHENCIIGNGFSIPLDECIFSGLTKTDIPISIGQGGSERQYFRIKKENKSLVLMQTSHKDPDFKRQIELTRFFCGLNIPVPQLIEADYNNLNAVFEDLGDISLYTWLKLPRTEEDIESIYKKVIDCLLLIHIKATRHISECHVLKERIFDYDHLRWESDYFIERFVIGIRNIQPRDNDALFKELHEIAFEANSFKKGLMHRDFQSQNIMVTQGRAVRIIDYQGARIGPQAYDVASILWDPYYRLNDIVRDRLLTYYTTKLFENISGEIDFSLDEFNRSLMLCRLQRHMQALGAYGFLSKVKGKRFFLKHIPEGLRLLKEDAFFLKYEYPALYNLTLMI